MNIPDILAERLTALGINRLLVIADYVGVKPRTARRAAKGLPVSASAALSLCAAIGLDPMTGEDIVPRKIGRHDTATMASAIAIAMDLRDHTGRDAAAAMDLSPPAVTRLRRGDPVSIATLIKAYRYLNRHPFDDCMFPVKHPVKSQTETGRAA